MRVQMKKFRHWKKKIKGYKLYTESRKHQNPISSGYRLSSWRTKDYAVWLARETIPPKGLPQDQRTTATLNRGPDYYKKHEQPVPLQPQSTDWTNGHPLVNSEKEARTRKWFKELESKPRTSCCIIPSQWTSWSSSSEPARLQTYMGAVQYSGNYLYVYKKKPWSGMLVWAPTLPVI